MTDAERLGGQSRAPGDVPTAPSAGTSMAPCLAAGAAASGADTRGLFGDPNAIHCVGASFASAAACCSECDTT